MEYKEYILKLTNKARQQALGEVEAGILRSDGRVAELQSEIKKLRSFLSDEDGHSSCCGVNREGFEGCDEAMFSCNCGYEEAKKQALEE